MKAVIVVPTYNERENVLSLIEQVLPIDRDLHILVVDDSSPDGTGQLVEELTRREPRVSLLRRPGKLGLGSAYVAGFKQALADGADLILEMDADHSHDPRHLPAFLSAAATHDVVLGSRYLHGVNVVNWPLSRLILSKAANVYARFVTGVPVCDLTGGYKCFRRRVLASIDLDHIRSDGYAFQIELTWAAWKLGHSITEVPIIFWERQAGASKLNRRIIWEALWLVWRLRLGSVPRLRKP